MAQPFKLSVQLEGHSADARSVAATKSTHAENPIILSGSRDGTARVWGKLYGAKSKRDIDQWYTLEGQSGFVNCCAWIEEGGTSDLIALAGGQDQTVNAYIVPTQGPSELRSLSPDYMLIGHEDNVCSLHTLPGKEGYIVSGSWDKTARVWKNWECVAVLGGHSQAVWSVLALDEDNVLTASADKVIRQFSISKAIKEGKDAKPIATYAGHSDAVRGLTRLDRDLFASCGNDGNINIYRISKSVTDATIQPSRTLSGHTSFVYSLALRDTGEVISSGEDRSVRVWRNDTLQQTITIPAISVWSVDVLCNGDIICGSSDGYLRIFTRTPQRVADEDILQAYDAAVSSQSLNKAQVGDVQKENLPGAEVLTTPGREGQVKMVRNGDLVEAHQYSSASGGWEKIGEVVGGVGSSQKKLYEGKEYDYVFDVDIADGVPPLKLPYNATENPYMAAQRFLEKNELPLTYLDQVVQFIEKNTGAVSLGGADQFRDPYTGASSYRPGAPAISAGAPAPSLSTAPSSASNSTASLLPHTEALTFQQFNEQGAKNKIAELNGQLSPSLAMSAEETESMNDLVSALSKSKPVLSEQSLSTLKAVLQRWPLSHRFPLLDVYRLACLNVSREGGSAAQFALENAQWSASWPTSADESKTRSTLSLLALRAVSNALMTESSDSLESLLTALKQGSTNIPHLSRPARVALSTVLLNVSTLVVKRKEKSDPVVSQLLSFLTLSLQGPERDGEALYRSMVTFGNILVSPSNGALGIGAVQECRDSLKKAMQGNEEARMQTLWREIETKSGIQ